MADTQIINPGCEDIDDDCDDERGKRGKRGKRGHRGHRGHEGPIGPTGPTGAPGGEVPFTFDAITPGNPVNPVTLLPGSVVAVAPLIADAAATRFVTAAGAGSVVIGISLSTSTPTANSPITVQADDIVTLTPAQWQAVIDGGAAPVRGQVVFTSQITAGNLTTTPPTALQRATLVGVFLNNTDLRLLEGPPLLGSSY